MGIWDDVAMTGDDVRNNRDDMGMMEMTWK